MCRAPRLDWTTPPRRPVRRHALLVNPFYAKDPRCSFGKHALTPSLALTSIAAATPLAWTVRLWDENLLQGAPPAEPLAELVGITVHITFAHRAYALSRWFRRLGARVVLGGPHVQACPAEAKSHADAIVVGDGVEAWPQVLADAARGRLERIYHGSFRRTFAAQPRPRRDLLDRRSYLTTASLMATRGCHNRCDFCTLSTAGLHVPYQRRPPEQVAAEWLADDQPYAVFIDNNLGSDRAYLRELCRTLRPLERIWSAAVSLDVTDQPELVREMALAGCTGVFVGLESLTDANLRDAGKRSPSVERFAERIGLFHEWGIQVNASFVLGFDHDRPDVFDRIIEFVEAERIECATFQIMTPYPGTPLFDRLASQGRLLHRDWRRYDTAHVVFRPQHMSPAELVRGYERCYERLFSHRSIWRRRPADPRALLPYLGMAYLYKRSNRLWHQLIRHRLTSLAWKPLVELSRRRHLKLRRHLAKIHSVVSTECTQRASASARRPGRARATWAHRGQQPHPRRGDRARARPPSSPG
jgi:radical SAM superfamily enzyme YgiQ (UPF0313 family)